MSKKEENDLFIFIEALKAHNYKGFKRSLLSSPKKNSNLKLALFEEISKGNLFNKTDFIKKRSLNEKQFSTLKFQLFQELLHFLKTNYDEFSDIALHNSIIEFELLLDKGLYYKAAKRLKKIKEIAFEKCDFNACSTVQMKAIEHKLYKYVYPKETREEASLMLREYQKISDNLNEFKLLSSDVLHAHYTYMDRRAENSDEILEYLKHPLLEDKSRASSVLSLFYFYKTKSSIYYGNNEYQKTKDYSLKAYHHLKQHPSVYRNDYLRSLICLNNYIDASFYLKETESYEIMYPQMIDIVKIASKTSDTYSNALIFQILATLKLNYLWIKKDTSEFYKEIGSIVESYTKYEFVLRPNFKLELIINIANLYFLAGDLKIANEYCKRIDFEKSNPTSLFISCAHILRIMINFDLKNYQYLSHLVSTSRYLLKKRKRLFDLEYTVLKSFTQIKYYYEPKEHQSLFDSLYNELMTLTETSENLIISNKIGLLDWVKQKSCYANN